MKKRSFIIFLITIALAIGTYMFGIILEFEYPYQYLLYKASRAKTIDNKNAMEVILSNNPNLKNRLHWHTCSYGIYNFDRGKKIKIFSPEISYIQLNIDDDSEIYHFAYNKNRDIIAPATHKTIERFPLLISDGIELVKVYEDGSGTDYYLPEQWVERNKMSNKSLQRMRDSRDLFGTEQHMVFKSVHRQVNTLHISHL